MNKLNKILTILIIPIGIIFLNGCVKEKFKSPAFTVPVSPVHANTTIRQLRSLHPTKKNGYVVPIPSNVIIEGVVVADDESGNYYEEVVIEDSTAGIEVLLNQGELYTMYRQGQRVFIKCGGLYLGNYGGGIQIGCYNASANNSTLEKIPPIYFNNYIFPDSLPGKTPAPMLGTLTTLEDSAYTDMLIQVDDVHFNTSDTGMIFAPQTANNTSMMLDDKLGNSLVVYTSKYANFSANIVPSGIGNIRGIITDYDGYELFLRTYNDLIPGSGWKFN
jgi:hypothetical protein